MPDAAILAILSSEFSIDIGYILTGSRMPVSVISEEEKRLVDNYRAMDDSARLNIQAVGDAFAATKIKSKTENR